MVLGFHVFWGRFFSSRVDFLFVWLFGDFNVFCFLFFVCFFFFFFFFLLFSSFFLPLGREVVVGMIDVLMIMN